MDIFTILFYGIIGIGAITIVVVTILRIDWARHPEKYKDDVDEQKIAYRKKKEQDHRQQLARAKQKEKAAKKQQRIDTVNKYRQKNSDKTLVANNLKKAGITPEKSRDSKAKK
jgi:hypothetical protein